MRNITCSKHSIEEYLNDNPQSQNPEKSLISLLQKMLIKSKTKEAKFFVKEETQTGVIRYKDQAIVYNNYHIITYYRIINIKVTQQKIRFNNLVWKILSWATQKAYNKKVDKHRIKIYNPKYNLLLKAIDEIFK